MEVKKTETLTLDKDVIDALKEEASQQGISLDDLVNDIIREHIKEVFDK